MSRLRRPTRVLQVGVASAVALAAVAACSVDPDQPSDTGAGDTGGGDTEGDVRRVPGVFLQPDAAALSPDGAQLVVPCLDDLCLWDAADGSLVTTYAGSKVVAWSPDGDLIATSDLEDGTDSVVLLDAATGDEVRRMTGHAVETVMDGVSLGIADLAFGPDSTTIASAGDDGAVRVWSVSDGEELEVLETQSPTPGALAFSPDGEQVAVAAPDAPVEIWDLASGERRGTLEAEPQGEVTWSPDGSLIATDTHAADESSTVRLWDAGSLEEESGYPEPVQADGLAFSPDGATLAMSQKDDSAVLLWPVTGGETRELTGHEESPRAVLWSPDGSRLYSVAARDGVLQWNLDTGEMARRFELPPE